MRAHRFQIRHRQRSIDERRAQLVGVCDAVPLQPGDDLVFQLRASDRVEAHRVAPADLLHEAQILSHLLGVQGANQPEGALIARPQRRPQLARGAFGGRRRIVQLVGHAGGQPSERGQFFLLEHGPFEGPRAGHDPRNKWSSVRRCSLPTQC
jgi:hypothetical protein